MVTSVAAGQIAVDGVGALLAVAGRLDQRGGAGHEVAAGEHAADVGGVRGGVDLEAAAVDLEAGLDGQEREVRRLGDRRDHRVRRDDELRALDRHRRPATGGVGLAELVADELDAREVAVLAGQLDRADEELHPDALALGLAQLLLVHDELGPRSTVGDGHVLGAVPEARARAVHRGVAAADDDDVAPDRHLLAQVRLLHVVDAVLDAVEVRAGDVEVDRVHGAGRDRDPVIVPLELVEGDVDADGGVEHELDAQPLDQADVHLDRLARQPEGGDADEHRAATEGQAVEHRELVALDRELARDREAGRAGADDGDPLGAGRDGRHDVGDPRRLVPLHEEPLHGADGQRPVDVAAAAGPLAGRRAHVRAHRRDRVGFARQDVALLEPAFGGEVEVAPAVGADGARFLALDVALQPGGVDRLYEEFLGRVDGHEVDVPFLRDRGRATGTTAPCCAVLRNLSSHDRPCTAARVARP